MAKVKRSTPLEGGTWDLSELGTVQHTSRWGTVARAKGSTLRYYPGCPWEKSPQCPPPEPPFWYLIHSVVLRTWDTGAHFRIYVAYRRHDWNYVLFASQGYDLSCPEGVEYVQYEFSPKGLLNGYILWEWAYFRKCRGTPPFSTRQRSALRFTPCPAGTLPPGYSYVTLYDSRNTPYPPQIFESKSYIKDCRAILCPHEPYIIVP